MLKHYLKQAYRTLKKSRLITIGSILTIFLGAISISMLFTYVYNELSMNNFHHKHKDIYIATIKATPESRWEVIEGSLFFHFNYKDYPELENLTSICKLKNDDVKLYNDKKIFSPEGIIADSSFFQIFDFKLKVGDKNTVLSNAESIVLTEQFAKKVFEKEDPIGKTVKIDVGFEKYYTVKGITENVPSNSSITFDFIVPKHSANFSKSGADLLLTKSGFNKDDFVKKIETIGQKHPQFTQSKIDLVALDDLYFNDKSVIADKIVSRFGDKKNNLVLYIIIVILFIITALNFSNLQIISINSSVKNIGIKTISGAKKNNLFHQKLVEVLLVIIVSVVLISLAYIVILPYFNQITGVLLAPHISFILFTNFLILSIITSLAMIYPTIVLFNIPVALSLKNQLLNTNKLIGRQIIIISQFALTIILLMVSLVVAKQLNMMLEKDLEFASKNIIKTKLIHEVRFNQTYPQKADMDAYNRFKEKKKKQENDYQYVRNELAASPYIEGFSMENTPIEPWQMPWKINSGEYTTQNTIVVNPEHKSLFGFEIVEGRFFDSEKDQSREDKVVINEAAKKLWNITDISNERLNNSYWEKTNGFQILGVVKDFNYEHLSVKPQPLVLCYFEDYDANFLIKIQEGTVQNGLQFVKKLHDEINPEEPFQYKFLTDEISELYNKEKKLSQIYILFTIVALLISVSGLFTIVIYDTKKRTKEIGVRKVNGAKVSEVMILLNRDFVKWILISFVLATPIAWYAMHKWLENFAYKTELSWWIFALAGLLALGVALFTISWQSWKAATRNPVEALRYE
jgi:putative ABC transport system permease protein